jgi:putative transposase
MTYAKPVLLATGPNPLWSWVITKLKRPQKWNAFHLYVILDVFSRYVVGWMVAESESARLAKRLLAETIGDEEVGATELTAHADRRRLPRPLRLHGGRPRVSSRLHPMV